MTFPAAVTKAPALPSRQGSLEVCAHSASAPPAPHPLTSSGAARHAILASHSALQCSKPSRSDLTRRFSRSFPQAPTPAKQNPIKNQHWAAV
jgi:hypothetical protein